jgi:hypothetical protein
MYVPGLVDPDRAIRFGAAIRPLCEQALKLELAYFIGAPGRHMQGEAPLSPEARRDYESIHHTITNALTGPSPRETYVMATYMNSDVRRFAWHVDPDYDIRPIVNIGDEKTAVLLSRSRGTTRRDPENIYLDEEPPLSDQIEVVLEPGDAYILDNRVLRQDRIPHSTPPHSYGRLMLRSNFIYSVFEDEPIDFGGFVGARSIAAAQPASSPSLLP